MIIAYIHSIVTSTKLYQFMFWWVRTDFLNTLGLSLLLPSHSSSIRYIEHWFFSKCHHIVILATGWIHHACSTHLVLGSRDTIVIHTLSLLSTTKRHLIIHECIWLSLHHSANTWYYSFFTALSVKVNSPILSAWLFLLILLVLACFWWKLVISVWLHRIHIFLILNVLSASSIHSLIIINVIATISVILIIVWSTLSCCWIDS